VSAATAAYVMGEDEHLTCSDCGEDVGPRETVVLTVYPDGETVEKRCLACQAKFDEQTGG
jgi:predicted RNA-binding Zn-ribbon protein involved in translation (DUF1610 family)